MNVNQASIYVWIFELSYELLDSSSLESSFNKVLTESSPSSSQVVSSH